MNDSCTPAKMSAAWTSSIANRWPLWLAPVIAAFYPYLLDVFHLSVTSAGGIDLAAALLLLAVFIVPLLGLLFACGARGHTLADTRARRLGLLLVVAPTLYCFVGVNLYMLGSPVADGWVWTTAWLALAALATLVPGSATAALAPRRSGSALRVAHGLSGVIVTIFVVFHLFNHLFGLLGSDVHAAIMDWGRTFYRATLIEPLLVAALLFQVVTGLRLAWQWSATPSDHLRLFQLASGVFLAVFILGHLNAVFVFARLWGGIETDWAFATGAPAGLIMDPWNIRLLPHYSLGVFFVLAHLGSGLRVVMLAHGASNKAANVAWSAVAGVAALLSLAIILGMTGLRLA
ncbi:hypothetical protein SAMN03159511_2412 [Pseudomonas sp. NFACC19-2]|nr:hypothetical protein [Pseudomonas sp. NFACC19-2]SFW32997.1 hypothetical protein SAMN03159511_2412 [Pseudomonas sp. NFACC19-2]